MEFGLKGKIAIVGGASKGLGRACALGLAREGVRVVICSRNIESLTLTADEITRETKTEVLPIAADLSKLEGIQNLVTQAMNHMKGLDIIVNNSGGPPAGTAQAADEQSWAKAVDMSLLFFARMCRETIPYLRKSDGGRIINIFASSIKQPIENLVLSAATRMGALGYAKTLADELARDGILVNNVAPGYLLTDRMTELVHHRANCSDTSYDEAMKQLTGIIPMGRFGKPEELANLVVFLASSAASYITGATIQVDGGVIRSMI